MSGGVENALIASAVVDAIATLVGVFQLHRRCRRIERTTYSTLSDAVDALRRLTSRSVQALAIVAAVPAVITVEAVAHEGGSRTRYVIPLFVVVALYVVMMNVAVRATHRTFRLLRGIEPPKSTPRGAAFGVVSVALTLSWIWFVAIKVRGSGEGVAIGRLALFFFGQFVLDAVLSSLIPFARRATSLSSSQRHHFMDLAHRHDVDLRDVRSYPGRAVKSANAFYFGALPRFHQVLLSDYLLEQLTPIEVDAIFVHELGHAKGHDVLIKLSVMPALLSALVFVPFLVRSAHGAGAAILSLMSWALLAGLVLVKGRLGVHLEERADDLAAQEVGPEILASALVKVAELNHTAGASSWLREVSTQHPGLERRVRRLGVLPTSGHRSS